MESVLVRTSQSEWRARFWSEHHLFVRPRSLLGGEMEAGNADEQCLHFTRSGEQYLAVKAFVATYYRLGVRHELALGVT